MSFDQDIKQLRTDRGMTQQDLADALHVSRQTISTWERGKNYPSLDVLKSISDLFDVSFEQLLFGGTKQMEQQEQNVAQSIDKEVSLKKRYKKTSILLGTIFALLIASGVILYIGYQKGDERIDRINPFLQYQVAYAKMPSNDTIKATMKKGDGRWTGWFSEDNMGLAHTKLSVHTGLNPGVKDPYVMVIHKGSFVKRARIVPGGMIDPLRKHDVDTINDFFETGWDGYISEAKRKAYNQRIHLGDEVQSMRYEGYMESDNTKKQDNK